MRKTVAGLASLFLLTQLVTIVIVGLITVPNPDSEMPREPKIRYLEGGDTIGGSVYIYFFLMAGVLLIAIAMKLKWGKFLFRNLEMLIIFLTTFLLLLSVFPENLLICVIPPFILVLLKKYISHWLFVSSLSVFLAAVVGAIMGVSLGIIPVIALMGFLSVYDVLAVKLSSHMRNVVHNVRGTSSSFLIEIPGMKSAVGISDLSVPAMFVACNMFLNSLGVALLVGAGGALGLCLAIVCSEKSGMVPALPFIFGTSVGTYLLAISF